MKKLFYLAVVLTVMANVNTFSVTKKSTSKKSSTTKIQVQSEPAQIALKFLNDYADLDNSIRRNPERIYNSSLFTDRFKEMYRNAEIGFGFWMCEEYGSSQLGCTDEGITEEQEEFVNIYAGTVEAYKGQDSPDKYEILDYNPSTGIVTLKGVWHHPNYRVLVKMIQENGEWKIDGAGEINIPKHIIKGMYDNNR